ncbi:hypothetical protein ACWKWP_07045 [Agromyces soli]
MPASFRPGPHGFVLARDARATGREAELRQAAAAGVLERVRVGVYRPAGNAPRRPREKHAELVRAAALSLARPVFTSYSAAAVLGLPILSSAWPTEVHLLSERSTGSRRPGVVEYGRLAHTELGRVGGIVTTSVELTLVQLCRAAPFADALAATDAALRAPRHRDDPPALTTLERLRAFHRELGRYRGSRRTEAVLAHATHLSDSPLETGSRILMVEEGFEAPVLQHRIALSELGIVASLDFYWPSVDACGEADGLGKYLGASARNTGTSPAAASAETVVREKERENAVRRRVRAFDRWNWNEYRARLPVIRRLVALGVPRPRYPMSFGG